MGTQYTFKYVSNIGVEITFSIEDTENCTDIVRQFAYFLKAVSFHQGTIKNALLEISNEMGD